MIACIQRVSHAQVTVDSNVCARIGQGLIVLLGVGHEDTAKQAKWLARKVAGLRIFEDEAGLMNLALADVGGEMLVVSQFTLLGDCRKGRRPSFIDAAEPQMAKQLYEKFVDYAKNEGIPVATGIFQAHMEVELVNDGPVTLLVETPS